MNKRGAIELSIGTIVIIVLAMTMLILGMVFIRSIMCSGIIITDQLKEGTLNEVKGLFGVNEYGIKCIGEGNEEIKLGDGGTRRIACVIKSDESKDYTLKIKDIESLSGVSTANVQKWIKDEGWKGTAGVGDTTAVVAVLDIPKKVDATSLKVTIEEVSESGTETHISYIDVVHIGTVTASVC